MCCRKWNDEAAASTTACAPFFFQSILCQSLQNSGIISSVTRFKHGIKTNKCSVARYEHTGWLLLFSLSVNQCFTLFYSRLRNTIVCLCVCVSLSQQRSLTPSVKSASLLTLWHWERNKDTYQTSNDRGDCWGKCALTCCHSQFTSNSSMPL